MGPSKKVNAVDWSSLAIGQIIEFTRSRAPQEEHDMGAWAEQFRLYMKEKRRLRKS
jgi:hypothetical protein